MAGAIVHYTIAALQAYFMVMNLTVERFYCHAPLKRGDTRLLVPETIDFCEKFNPLFLSRPEWMRAATCVSAYCFAPCYLLTLVAALTGSLKRVKPVLLLFIGAKLNAIGFYHFMEFTSSMPPPNPPAYFAVEGPYLISIGLVLYVLFTGGPPRAPQRAKQG